MREATPNSKGTARSGDIVKQAYLFMNEGVRSGAHYRLKADVENLLGRGLECQVVVDDPQCSRVHASLLMRGKEWWLNDSGSRNGTMLDGTKVSKSPLREGSQIQIGETVFTFGFQTEDKPHFGLEPELPTFKTVILEQAAPISDTGHWAWQTLKQQTSSEDIYFIFELAIKLMSADSPDEVISFSLNKLAQRVNASVAGFLWANDMGDLAPKLVLPPDAIDKLELATSITDLVSKERQGVRVDHLDSSGSGQKPLADSICVPLARFDRVLGAIHLYRDEGRFRENDLQLAQAVAELTVRCLVRAREHSKLMFEHKRLKEQIGETDQMIGQSKPIKLLKKNIKKVAAASGCVLVRGESGSGKELVAGALHRNSNRSDRAMLSVNCAAIPRDLMESQLFGHKKGAFTGADADHVGWFQQADTGTLFLDEVGELNLEGQAKLLRILEGHPFLPVGSNKEVSVDVRVICATNRDLSEFVKEKQFREDLFYRLTVFELVVPPVRERGSDIGLLIDHFVDLLSVQHGRTGLKLSEEAREVLVGYDWPGNVRQMRNVIDSAIVMSEGECMQTEDLSIREVKRDDHDVGFSTLRLDHWERELIKKALQRTENSVPKAAKLLGVSRATLYRKVEEYGIER